jgi:hypothetical protein
MSILEKTIELDCAPGYPRPGDLIPAVVAGTILESMTTPEFIDKHRPFFGNATYDYSAVTDDEWLEVKPTIQERVEALYSRGSIRYGSW